MGTTCSIAPCNLVQGWLWTTKLLSYQEIMIFNVDHAYVFFFISFSFLCAIKGLLVKKWRSTNRDWYWLLHCVRERWCLASLTGIDKTFIFPLIFLSVIYISVQVRSSKLATICRHCFITSRLLWNSQHYFKSVWKTNYPFYSYN